MEDARARSPIARKIMGAELLHVIAENFIFGMQIPIPAMLDWNNRAASHWNEDSRIAPNGEFLAIAILPRCVGSESGRENAGRVGMSRVARIMSDGRIHDTAGIASCRLRPVAAVMA